MKFLCPYCNGELDTENDEPETVQYPNDGSYTLHKVICHNREHHSNKVDMVVVFTPQEKKSEV